MFFSWNTFNIFCICKELRKECEWIWNAGLGYKVVGPNKNYIFLTVGGYRHGWGWGYAWREYNDTYELDIQKSQRMKFIKEKNGYRALVQLRKIQQ